jgi:hypothetical protein
MIKKNILSIALVFALLVITLLHFSGTSMLKKNGTSHWLGADVALATWILERAQTKNTISEFYQECRWAKEGCFRYDSVPMEWPFLFQLGKVGKYLNLDAMSTMDFWFLATFALNCIFVFISLYILTKDRWGAALCLLPIIFQYSVVQRVAWGHLVLTFIAPIILSLTICYKSLETIKNKEKSANLYTVVIAFCTLITFYTSYYYTGFSFILHLSLVVIFLLLYRTYKDKSFVMQSLKKVVLPAAVGALVGILLNRHIFTGANGVFDGDIYDRKFIGVSLYSARILEFIKPLPDTALGMLLKIFKISYANTTNRGEVYSYQGSAVVLSLMLILIFSLTKNFKKNIQNFFSSKSPELFYFLMAIVALFFTCKFGGIVVFYTLTKSFRAFSRMAPFATFFMVAFLILWANRNLKEKSRYIAYGLFFALSLFESYNSEALGNLRSYTTSPLKQKVDDAIKKTDSMLPRLCANGYIEMAPAFTKDFLNSQWTIQYFLEKHNCQAINGSYISDFKNPNQYENRTLTGKIELSSFSWNGADFLTVTEY